jgi:hypothetical protein
MLKIDFATTFFKQNPYVYCLKSFCHHIAKKVVAKNGKVVAETQIFNILYLFC